MTQPPSNLAPPVAPGQPIVVQFPNMSELQRQAQASQSILALASGIKVTNEAQLKIANEAAQLVLRARDALEADRTAVTGPLYKTKAWIDAQYRPVRETIDEAARIIKAEMGAFVQAQRAEEQRKWNEAQAAHAAGQHEAMALALNERTAIVTAAPTGTTVTETWTAEVFNPGLVPYAFLCPDLAKIGAHASATSLDREPEPIPGVRFKKVAAVTVRR